MDETLRTWLWFASVVLAMAITPVVAGGWLIYGAAELYKHWHAPFTAWTLRALNRKSASPSATAH